MKKFLISAASMLISTFGAPAAAETFTNRTTAIQAVISDINNGRCGSAAKSWLQNVGFSQDGNTSTSIMFASNSQGRLIALPTSRTGSTFFIGVFTDNNYSAFTLNADILTENAFTIREVTARNAVRNTELTFTNNIRKTQGLEPISYTPEAVPNAYSGSYSNDRQTINSMASVVEGLSLCTKNYYGNSAFHLGVLATTSDSATVRFPNITEKEFMKAIDAASIPATEAAPRQSQARTVRTPRPDAAARRLASNIQKLERQIARLEPKCTSGNAHNCARLEAARVQLAALRPAPVPTTPTTPPVPPPRAPH